MGSARPLSSSSIKERMIIDFEGVVYVCIKTSVGKAVVFLFNQEESQPRLRGCGLHVHQYCDFEGVVYVYIYSCHEVDAATRSTCSEARDPLFLYSLLPHMWDVVSCFSRRLKHSPCR